MHGGCTVVVRIVEYISGCPIVVWELYEGCTTVVTLIIRSLYNGPFIKLCCFCYCLNY